MKTVVSVNEISEFEIKPEKALAEWKKKVAEEIESAWKEKELWTTVACPVCNESNQLSAFTKMGFEYVECAGCKTLYAQTRPSASALTRWYTQSESVRFWKDTLLRETESSRLEKIIEPRAYWILDGISEYMPQRPGNDFQYTDVSFFGRALVNKIAAEAPGLKITSSGITDAEEPYAAPNAGIKKLSSLNAFAELPATDILVAVDLLERIPDIREFFKAIENTVNDGGLVFATCPVSSGFEIQSLWENSPSIIPPDKLNLPSVQGLLDLFSASGTWKALELSTPGMFDVGVVKQVMSALPDANWPRVLHALMDTITDQGIEQFTEYLQSQRLSSFARIVLRKEKN